MDGDLRGCCVELVAKDICGELDDSEIEALH